MEENDYHVAIIVGITVGVPIIAFLGFLIRRKLTSTVATTSYMYTPVSTSFEF